MNSTQYTIRSIPKKLDQTLRLKAKQSGKSLNTIVVEYLQTASGTANESTVFTDLDWFYGSGSDQDAGFDDAQTWLNSAPKEIN